ncbi:MAG: hypothetical protein HY927_09475, partial [Elusimicrobia bacterium]|nr:hypothetical protein [Elusimicrobiota bacterium]
WVALDGLELGCVADTLHVFLLAKAKAAEESRNGRYVFIGADDLNAIGHRLASADPSEALWRLVLAQHEEEGRSALKGYAAKACLKPGSLTREDAGEIRKAYVLLDEYRLAARRGYTLPDSALQGLSGCVKEMMEFMLRSQQKYGTAPLGPWEEFYNSYSGEIARKYPSEQGGQNDRTQTSPEPGRVKLPSEDEIRRRMDDIRRRLGN